VTLGGGGIAVAIACPLSPPPPPPQALIDPAATAATPRITILHFTFVLL
jgi:hypothetical protein